MGGVDRLLQESAAAVGEGRSAWPSADDRSPDRGPFGLVNPNLTPTTAESLDGQSEDVVGAERRPGRRYSPRALAA
jgi:hypothetical protein